MILPFVSHYKPKVYEHFYRTQGLFSRALASLYFGYIWEGSFLSYILNCHNREGWLAQRSYHIWIDCRLQHLNRLQFTVQCLRFGLQISSRLNCSTLGILKIWLDNTKMYIKYIFTRYHLRTSIKSELQSRKNYLEQSKIFQ